MGSSLNANANAKIKQAETYGERGSILILGISGSFSLAKSNLTLSHYQGTYKRLHCVYP